MFVRAKKSGKYDYLQIVHNERIDGRVKQNVIATLGRLDVLRATGRIDALIASCGRFAQQVAVIDASRRGRIPAANKVRIGPNLVFGRLWKLLGIGDEIQALVEDRRFGFDVERAVYLTVLHRLFVSGSDRAAEKWKSDYRIPEADSLELHHLYRAMAFLGEELPTEEQEGRTPFSPRCTKDRIEERLFARRRDLFTGLELVFFDTTSIYFEGEGGTIGVRGNSKDNRPDLKQMVVGVVLDMEGAPVCCEMWPGNTTDVKSLVPVVSRMKKRFGIGEVCIVADRGMISRETIDELESPQTKWKYILGARMRRQKEIGEQVVSRAGRYRELVPERSNSKDPSPLKVKEVWEEGRRYVVCLNEEQRRKDAIDRQAIVEHLREQLKRGEKALIGNKGYRKYVTASGEHRFAIDEKKIEAEARYDGKWVLRTNMDVPAAEVALKYKQLWMVEDIFRSMKSILETRPIYHQRTETIRGHVFCSFLALVLRKELQKRMEGRGWKSEWADVRDDLDNLEEFEVDTKGQGFIIRSRTRGEAGRAIQATGVALGPVVRLKGAE